MGGSEGRGGGRDVQTSLGECRGLLALSSGDKARQLLTSCQHSCCNGHTLPQRIESRVSRTVTLLVPQLQATACSLCTQPSCPPPGRPGKLCCPYLGGKPLALLLPWLLLSSQHMGLCNKGSELCVILPSLSTWQLTLMPTGPWTRSLHSLT